jgi:hypothetical protein
MLILSAAWASDITRFSLPTDYMFDLSDVVLQGTVTEVDFEPQLVLYATGESQENCRVTLAVEREVLGQIATGVVDVWSGCDFGIRRVAVGYDVWLAGALFRDGITLAIPDSMTKEFLFPAATDAIVASTMVSMLHRVGQGEDWLVTNSGGSRACLGYVDGDVRAGELTLGIGNCDPSLDVDMIAALEAARGGSRAGVTVKGSTTQAPAPGVVPASLLMTPASAYHDYAAELSSMPSPSVEYGRAVNAGELSTREGADKAVARYVEGLAKARRGAAGCAHALRIELTRRRAAHVQATGELVAPLPLEVKLQVISDWLHPWPTEDWRGQLDEAAARIGTSADQLGEVVDCLPPRPGGHEGK